jgi:hypothetical protein
MLDEHEPRNSGCGRCGRCGAAEVGRCSEVPKLAVDRAVDEHRRQLLERENREILAGMRETAKAILGRAMGEPPWRTR